MAPTRGEHSTHMHWSLSFFYQVSSTYKYIETEASKGDHALFFLTTKNIYMALWWQSVFTQKRV